MPSLCLDIHALSHFPPSSESSEGRYQEAPTAAYKEERQSLSHLGRCPLGSRQEAKGQRLGPPCPPPRWTRRRPASACKRWNSLGELSPWGVTSGQKAYQSEVLPSQSFRVCEERRCHQALTTQLWGVRGVRGGQTGRAGGRIALSSA